MSWYALYTSGGSEEKVLDILKKQIRDFDFYIYRRLMRERNGGTWHNIERKLFPGYILMEGTMTEDAWYELKATDASFTVLRNEGDYLTLSDQEVRTLKLLDQKQDGLVDMSRVYMEGDKIHVIDGPLVGQEVRIIEVNKRKGRVKVQIDFCGSVRIIELGVEVIEKV